MAYSLLRELSLHSNINLSVILLNDGRLSEKLLVQGIKLQIFDESRYSFPVLIRQMRDQLRTRPPDVIHAHRYKENLLAFLAIQGICRPALVSTLHGLPEAAGTNPSLPVRFKSWLNFFILSRYFATTVAVSADICNQLKELHRFVDNRIAMIHNGVCLPENSRNNYPSSRSRHFTIGSSGRLFPVKDFPLFFEVARIVAEKEPSIRFELAGDGPGRSQLENLLAAYGLQGRFRLLGHVDDMESFYSGLDLYLNTSHHEGIPMTILEAMGRGIPVVAPSVGGIREIITPGKDGFLINDRNPASFADKCLQLYFDRHLLQAMAQAAREKVEHDFSVVKMADSYYRLYSSIINSAHRERAK